MRFLRFSQDIQVADVEFPFAFLNFATNVLGTIGTFVFITIATPLLAFALPILAVLGFYALRFYLMTSKVCTSSATVWLISHEIFSNSADLNSRRSLLFVVLGPV
jgi:hypothetical protein